MPGVDIAIFDATARLPLAAWRGDAQFSHGEHGAEAATVAIPLGRFDAFGLYNRLSANLSLRVTGGGARVWEGRIEDISITDQGATVQALGRWRALRDLPHTALWSDTQWERWRATQTNEISGRTPDRYIIKADDSLFMTLKKNAAYNNNTHVGALVYLPPDQTARQIVGFSIAYQVLLPTNWTFRVVAYAGPPGAFTVSAVLFTAPAASGVLQTASAFVTHSAADYLAIEIFNATGATYTNLQEDGDWYVNIPFIRAVSLSSNTISTTLGTAVAAPGTQAVTPGSMAGIYEGQRLFIGGSNPESVIASNVTSTQFTATYVRTHLAADSVRAFLLYGSDIASAFPALINATNSGSGELSTSTALISSSALDVLDAVYEDADMGEILTALAALGDASGNPYETGVDGSMLYFRPVGSAAQAWYVDATSLEVQQTLDQLYNSVYARYSDPSGRTLRTANQADSASITRYGLTRRRAVDADTTNATLATRVAQTSRDDTKNPIPRASVRFARVYTATGALSPLWQVRNGDTITIRNLPPVAGVTVDLIRTFRVFDCEYNASDDTLSVTPETPLPLLEYLLARREAFGDVAAGRLAR